MILSFTNWLLLKESDTPTNFSKIPPELHPIVQDYWNLRKKSKQLCDISGEEHNTPGFCKQSTVVIHNAIRDKIQATAGPVFKSRREALGHAYNVYTDPKTQQKWLVDGSAEQHIWDHPLRQLGINLPGVATFGDLMLLIDVIDGVTNIKMDKSYSIPYDPTTKKYADYDKTSERATQYQGREQQFQKLASYYGRQIDKLKGMALPYALKIEPFNTGTHPNDPSWGNPLTPVQQAYDTMKEPNVS